MLDLTLFFLLVITFVIEFHFAPRIEEVKILSKESFNTSDNFDIGIFFNLNTDKMGFTELSFALSVFLCMLRTIAYLEVFPTVVKTIQLMYLMISELGVYLMFFFLIVISFAILYFVLFGQAYEDGVAQSSSWWAFTQLTMIHEDDFKDMRTSPKYMAKKCLKAKCCGKASGKISDMRKAIDKQYDEIWTDKEHRKNITSSDLLRMNTSDALIEEWS
eukprot:g6402.t1